MSRGCLARARAPRWVWGPGAAMENEHKNTRDRQVEGRVRCLLHPLLAHLLTEHIDLQSPRGWQTHKREGNSVLIHRLVESHPPTKHTYVELLGEGERNGLL